MIRNKAIFLTQGHNQQEGTNFTETFAPVVCLKAIQILLAFVVYKVLSLFEMDIKSSFFNGFIEEVFVNKPLILKTFQI